MRTDEEGFLEAIRRNSEDQVARLVYADWLEERGDARAEFVRLLAKRNEIDIRLREMMVGLNNEWLKLFAHKRNIILNSVRPGRFIDVAKAVREFTGMGLKDVVDHLNSAPVTLKSGVPVEEAEQFKATMEDIAEVSIEPTI